MFPTKPRTAKEVSEWVGIPISPQKLGAIRRQSRRSAERMSKPIDKQRYRALQDRWHALYPDAPRDPGYTEDEEFAELFDDMGNNDLDCMEEYIAGCEQGRPGGSREGFGPFGIPNGVRTEDAAKFTDAGLRRWFRQMVKICINGGSLPADIPTSTSKMSRAEMLAVIDRNPYIFAPIRAQQDKPRGH